MREEWRQYSQAIFRECAVLTTTLASDAIFVPAAPPTGHQYGITNVNGRPMLPEWHPDWTARKAMEVLLLYFHALWGE